MKNEGSWSETLVTYNKEELTINEQYVSNRSLLVVEQMVKVYEKVIRQYARGIMLDLGCGTVPYYNIYKDQVDEVICIDWENSFHKNTHLDYNTDLNKGIPLDGNSVDTVLLTDVLEHISKPNILTGEISRVLRNGGKLILGVPFMYWLHEEPFDFHRYTKYQLVELCNENSLKILFLEEVGGALTIISDIIAKNLPPFFAPRLFQRIMMTFLKTKFGKKIDQRNKQKFPRSYCLVAEKQ